MALQGSILSPPSKLLPIKEPHKSWNRNFLHTAVLANEPGYLGKALPLASKEEINHRDVLGCTPVCYAAFLLMDEAVDILKQHGADLEIQDNEGRSALHWIKENEADKTTSDSESE